MDSPTPASWDDDNGEDDDGDGFSEEEGDCDDTDMTVYPGADEYCDETDSNCDGEIDNDAIDHSLVSRYGSDGFGIDYEVLIVCAQPEGYADNGDDCDDLNALTYPGAEEVCDDIDSDCDGEIDNNAIDASLYYMDVDGDGYGNPDDVITSCTEPGGGYVSNDEDCDDNDASINPDADESWFLASDGIDQNCDGQDGYNETDCTDGIDNDGDGLLDCDDDACANGCMC